MRQGTAHLLITQHLAMIAHLDAIEERLTSHLDRLDGRLDHVDLAIAQLREEVAGIKLDQAIHETRPHGDDS